MWWHYTKASTNQEKVSEECTVPVHKLDQVDLELVGVHFGELLKREGPAVQAGTEAHRALARVYTYFTCSAEFPLLPTFNVLQTTNMLFGEESKSDDKKTKDETVKIFLNAS